MYEDCRGSSSARLVIQRSRLQLGARRYFCSQTCGQIRPALSDPVRPAVLRGSLGWLTRCLMCEGTGRLQTGGKGNAALAKSDGHDVVSLSDGSSRIRSGKRGQTAPN